MANRKHEGASHATPLSPFFRVTVGFNFLLLQIFGVGFFWSVQPWPKSSPVENNEPPTPPTALMAEERSQHGARWEIPPLPPGPAQWVKCFIPAWSLNKQALHKESRWGREAAVPRTGVNAATALRVNHYSSWTGTIPGNAAALLGEPASPLLVVWLTSAKLCERRLTGQDWPWCGSYFRILLQMAKMVISELRSVLVPQLQTLLQVRIFENQPISFINERATWSQIIT